MGSAAGPAAQAAGGVLKAGGEIFGGLSEQGAANAQKNIARQNADIAERNASLTADVEGERAGEMLGMRQRAQAGSLKARQASSGVDVNSGSAADARASQRMVALSDQMTLRSNAARAAYGYKVKASDFRNEAAIAKAKANQAMWSAGINAASSLLGAASSASTAYQGWQATAGDATEALTSGGTGSAAAAQAMLAFG